MAGNRYRGPALRKALTWTVLWTLALWGVAAAAGLIAFRLSKDNSNKEAVTLIAALFGQTGQLLLIPVALFGFELARREFEAAQAKPELSLRLCRYGTDETTDQFEPELAGSHFGLEVEIRIQNDGTAPAMLYRVEMAIDAGPRARLESYELVGQQAEDWDDDLKDNGKIAFTSKNRYPVFPGIPLRLCVLAITLPEDSNRRHVDIQCTAYGDRGRPTEQTLIAHFSTARRQ
jgi:hypothetical protein